MNILKRIATIILAGLISLGIVSCVLCVYSITPVHTANGTKNTDYVWPSGCVWVKMTEGIAFGRFDENGFNNEYVPENPDVLIVGSSHMEAMNVFQSQTVGSLLNTAYEGKYTFYNMGISGHHFYKISQYLLDSISYFENTPKLVIMETSSVQLNSADVEKVLTKSVKFTPSHETGLLALLQKIPVFRLVYQQIDGGLLDSMLKVGSGENEEASYTYRSSDIEIDEKAYDELFSYLEKAEKETGTQILIFYHPTGSFDESGNLVYPDDVFLLAFAQYAEKYGIDFLDMTPIFEENYRKKHWVPHGFVTGRLEEGHLNAYGHTMIAEAIEDKITEMEACGTICQ